MENNPRKNFHDLLNKAIKPPKQRSTGGRKSAKPTPAGYTGKKTRSRRTASKKG